LNHQFGFSLPPRNTKFKVKLKEKFNAATAKALKERKATPEESETES
jgi:hypothetical protein